MVARPMISALRSVKPRDLCVQTSKSKFGKRSSNKRCGVRMHQKNNHSIYDMSFRDLGIILKTLRVHQIYGEEDSSMYDPAIDLVRLRMHELKMQTLNDRMNEYMVCCSEIERFKEIENRNIEKERFYSKFSSWRPSTRHTEFTHDDKLMEAQVRLYEIVERCRDFEQREKIFKKSTFGRLASRIDF
jgi:hypothetical protein